MDPQFGVIFWPTVAATLVGVFLGVLPALLIARFSEGAASTTRRVAEAQRLNRALQVLDAAMTRNAAALLALTRLDMLPAGQFVLTTQLETTTWEAVQGDVTPFLHDPDLQARLAYHFALISQIMKLHDRYVDFMAGVASALANAPQTRRELTGSLGNLASRASSQVGELRPRLQAAIASSARG